MYFQVAVGYLEHLLHKDIPIGHFLPPSFSIQIRFTVGVERIVTSGDFSVFQGIDS